MKGCSFDFSARDPTLFGESCRTSPLLLTSVVLLVLLLVPPELKAQIGQPPVAEKARSWFLGGSFGMGSFGIDGIPDLCGEERGETNLSLHAGRRIRPSLSLEGIITGHMDLGAGPDCTEVTIGSTSTSRTVASYRGIPHYPYGSTVARAIIEPGQQDAPFRPRLLLGGGWMWGASAPYLTAGIGFSSGGPRTRFVLDAVNHWFRSDYDVVEQTWTFPLQGGRPTLVGETANGRSVSTGGFMIRIGFQHFLGTRP